MHRHLPSACPARPFGRARRPIDPERFAELVRRLPAAGGPHTDPIDRTAVLFMLDEYQVRLPDDAYPLRRDE